MKKWINIAITLVLVAVITLCLFFVWDRYMYTPWTRDGRVRADIVNIAPDVSGWVKEMHAHNAQQVKSGDLLFVIDKQRYQIAVDVATAAVETARVQWQRSKNVYERRRDLVATNAVSREIADNARLDMLQNEAAYKQAQANLDSAKLDLERTSYRAPASGRIINLELEQGDYVHQGTERLALVKDDSFYVTGYFEETKIPGVQIGDSVDIWLSAGTQHLEGHVTSIDSGISNDNATPGNQLLPNVEATFSWVRLAQRIPVNIQIDEIPRGVHLSSGMSATIKIKPADLDGRHTRSALSALGENFKAALF